MSAAQLRELAGLLPQAEGNRGTRLRCPRVCRSGLPGRISRRILRSTFWARSRSIESGRAAGCDGGFRGGRGTRHGQYAAAAGDATLMLIEYPTSQIAAERLRRIDASHQITGQQPGVASIVDVGPFFDARTGPIVVIAAGPLSKSEARELMASISYDADVTWNETPT